MAREYTTIRYTIYEVVDGKRVIIPGNHYDLDMWYSNDNNGWQAAHEALERVRQTDPKATFDIEEAKIVVKR